MSSSRKDEQISTSCMYQREDEVSVVLKSGPCKDRLWNKEQLLTVSLCESPSFLPMSLLIQSSPEFPSLDCRPGTTRGMVRIRDTEKKRVVMGLCRECSGGIVITC
jgi:hypothetical protein